MHRVSRLASATQQALDAEVVARLLYSNATVRRSVTVRGADGVEREVSLQKYPPKPSSTARFGAVYKPLSSRIGYVDLTRLETGQIDPMLDMFENTDAIVMDMRGYPRADTWALASRLTETTGKVTAQIRTNVVGADVNGAGGSEVCITSQIDVQRIPQTDKPRYKGKTILLIDDRAMSASEHSGMVYKIANGTVFVGSATIGANGDLTGFMAPGGINIPFSGHDIRWPDGKQLQRVGLLPDIEVHPTVQGIREGRDEILERAIRYILTGK